MIFKIPVYYQIEVAGDERPNNETLKETLAAELEEHLSGSSFTLTSSGFLGLKDCVTAKHVTLQEVHEFLRTKK